MISFGQHVLSWSRLGWTPDDIHAEFDHGVLMIGVDVSDAQCHSSVRSLRAEYDGRRVLVGDDPSGQYVRPLDEQDPRVCAYDVLAASPEAVGRAIADRLGLELQRPIYREEWDRLPERF